MATSSIRLVTGASGYIASHVVKQLLVQGNVRVRGTVRSLKDEKKTQLLRDLVPDARFPLELVEADLMNEESWKEAVKDVELVEAKRGPRDNYCEGILLQSHYNYVCMTS